MIEVALGAEDTTAHEAEEFREKMNSGEKLMTTSCCPAYVELVRKFIPDFMQYVSSTPSPMVFAAEIARRDIRRVVYISCEPETLGRDCAVFREFGYGIGEVQPVDLFPRTGHVENVVCIAKEEK